MNINIGVDEQE